VSHLILRVIKPGDAARIMLSGKAQAKRGAQQSPDCEHPSEPGNAGWRHEAPLDHPVSDGARGYSLSLKQSARFFPSAPPMLGAGQRGKKPK
jgi:hypothetical protein